MNYTSIIFNFLFIGGITGAYKLVSSLRKIKSYNINFNQLQYFVLVSVAIGNVMQPLCGSLNIAASSYLPGGIGNGLRCYLDGAVSYGVDLTMLNLMVLVCVHSVLLNKPSWTKSTNVLMVGLCWLIGSFWALPPLCGITNYTQKVGNTFCCVDFLSKLDIDRLYLFSLASVGFTLPIAIILTSFCKHKCTTVAESETTTGFYIKSNSLLKIALLRILMGQLYAFCALANVFGYGEYVNDNMEYVGLVLMLSAYTIVPTLLSNELNDVISRFLKSK